MEVSINAHVTRASLCYLFMDTTKMLFSEPPPSTIHSRASSTCPLAGGVLRNRPCAEGTSSLTEYSQLSALDGEMSRDRISEEKVRSE
jgi:hypothetical protein